MAVGAALVGLLSLTAVGTRYERAARFAVFAGDTIAVTALLAFFPLSSGAEVPQNLVFLTARVQYYYILIAAAILTLSPALVLWTGAWAVVGLLFATAWVLQGIETVVSFQGLGVVRSRDDFLTFLDPNFLSLSLRFREAVIIATVAVIAGWGVYRARRAIEAHARVDAERRYVERMFAQYLPRSVMSDLINYGHLEPQTREATVLFIDIEGFTHIAETMSPDRLLKLLNALFSAITTVIDRSGGVVVSYIGDAVLASYNAPLQASEPALQAVQAAERIIALVSQRQFESVSVRVRIGIATGRVVAGTVGSGSRQTYTLYGDAVNLAQRLEVLNKDYGTRCLACGATARLARSGRTRLQPVGLVPIRNREQPIEVFKLP